MEIIGTVYTLRAVANRLGKTKNALRQAIKRLKAADMPLEIGDFKFLLIEDMGYIGMLKNEDLIVIEE